MSSERSAVGLGKGTGFRWLSGPSSAGLCSSSVAADNLPKNHLAMFPNWQKLNLGLNGNTIRPRKRPSLASLAETGGLWRGCGGGMVVQVVQWGLQENTSAGKPTYRVGTCLPLFFHLAYRDGWSARCEHEAEGEGIPEPLTSLQTIAHAACVWVPFAQMFSSMWPSPNGNPLLFPWDYLHGSAFLLTQWVKVNTV